MVPKHPRQFLSLKQFLLRQEVLKLYRDILRTARKTDTQQKQEIVQWARSDFEQYKNVKDEDTIKRLIFNGRQMLKELQGTMKKTL